jgi:hypothetical protein
MGSILPLRAPLGGFAGMGGPRSGLNAALLVGKRFSHFRHKLGDLLATGDAERLAAWKGNNMGFVGVGFQVFEQRLHRCVGVQFGLGVGG